MIVAAFNQSFNQSKKKKPIEVNNSFINFHHQTINPSQSSGIEVLVATNNNNNNNRIAWALHMFGFWSFNCDHHHHFFLLSFHHTICCFTQIHSLSQMSQWIRSSSFFIIILYHHQNHRHCCCYCCFLTKELEFSNRMGIRLW